VDAVRVEPTLDTPLTVGSDTAGVVGVGVDVAPGVGVGDGAATTTAEVGLNTVVIETVLVAVSPTAMNAPRSAVVTA
jgi:hypothetical protein